MRRAELEAVSDKYCISGGAGSSLISYGACLQQWRCHGAVRGNQAAGGLGEDASLR